MPVRLSDIRRRIAERGPIEPTPNRMPAAIIAAIGAEKAAALEAGTELSRDWKALDHRSEVERLSLAGMPVKQIASTLGLSTRHVVELRAQLGVGRRR